MLCMCISFSVSKRIGCNNVNTTTVVEPLCDLDHCIRMRLHHATNFAHMQHWTFVCTAIYATSYVYGKIKVFLLCRPQHLPKKHSSQLYRQQRPPALTTVAFEWIKSSRKTERESYLGTLALLVRNLFIKFSFHPLCIAQTIIAPRESSLVEERSK